MNKYTTEEVDINERPYTSIAFVEGPYAGIRFLLGKVEFKPKDGVLVMHYEYDVLDDVQFSPESLAEFRTLVGDLVLQLIEEGHATGTNVFTGGTE
jgi:hypothetical protein